jgi:hypothetical protein
VFPYFDKRCNCHLQGEFGMELQQLLNMNYVDGQSLCKLSLTFFILQFFLFLTFFWTTRLPCWLAPCSPVLPIICHQPQLPLQDAYKGSLTLPQTFTLKNGNCNACQNRMPSTHDTIYPWKAKLCIIYRWFLFHYTLRNYWVTCWQLLTSFCKCKTLHNT